MARTESPLTARGVELIRARLAAGEHPQMRATAVLLGIDLATLHRACKRAGLTLPRGRPKS
jgi:hypothetical protein